MKKLVVFCIIALVSVSSIAGPMQKGNIELRLDAAFDLEQGTDDGYVTAHCGMGRFLSERILVGGMVAFERREWGSYWGVSDVWGLGGYGEYHFVYSDTMIPYLSLALTYLDGNNPDNDVVYDITTGAGVKIFVTDTIMLAGQLNYAWASEDIHDYDRSVGTGVIGTGSDTDVTGSIGIRVLY